MTHWPQLTILGLMAMSLGMHIAKHGEPRSPYNFVVMTIALAIEIYVLSSGGFFAPLGW